MFSNSADYLGLLVFPWGAHEVSFLRVGLTAVSLTLIGIALFRRSVSVLCLLLILFLTLSPVIPFSQGANTRFLNLPGIPVTILWAFAVEMAWVRWKSRWVGAIAGAALASIAVLSASTIADAAGAMAETSRQQRVPFRDIMLQNASFASSTRLFFVEPPYNTPIKDIDGMFFLRYGANVSVSGTFEDGVTFPRGILRSERARLREFGTAYVYYFDENRRPVQIPVDKEENTKAVPPIPENYEVPIRLEGYEITSSMLKRDHTLALILYWRAIGKIEKNYTVFVHLVNANGEIVVGTDGMPRDGKERTSHWRTDQFTADVHIMTIPHDLIAGKKLYLEVGLYNLPTLERVSVIDSRGIAIDDKIVIEPIEVQD